MAKDYSIYKYYKGSDNFPNNKAKFYGTYEKQFDLGYNGKPEDKEEAFKDFMANLLYQQTSDANMFTSETLPSEKDKCYQEKLDEYFKPEKNVEFYNR